MVVEFLVKASIVLALALCAALAARGRSAALRHFILACGIAAALVLPALSLVAPGWDVPVASVATQSTAAAPAPLPTAGAGKAVDAPVHVVSSQVPRLQSIAERAGVVWLAGTGVLLAMLGAGLVQLRRIEWSAAPPVDPALHDMARELAATLGITRPVQVLVSARQTLPMTWGRRIVLPRAAADWPPARTRVVLLHELAHVARGDWSTHVAATLMRALLWINPLAWLACSRLRQEAERAADDVVLAAGVDGAEYASHLVAVARQVATRSSRFIPTPAIVETTQLERRVRAMLSVSTNRQPVAPRARAMLMAVACVVAVSVAGGSAAQNFASFVGSVVDPQNAVLPGVEFTLTHEATGTQRKISSDRSGRVELNELSAGVYSIEVSLPGFSTLRSRVTLQEGQRLEPQLMLQVGEIEETVTIVDDGTPARRIYATTRPAPPSCPAGPVSPTGQAIGGNIRPPRKIQNIAPDYPAALAGSGASGDVRLFAQIGADGRIDNVNVEASPRQEFADAAVEAVKQWEFTPTLLNCQAVPVRMHVFARFTGRQ